MKKKAQFLNLLLNAYTIIGIILIILATVFFLAPYGPFVWYHLNEDATQTETEQIDPSEDSSFSELALPREELQRLPPLDTSLTTTNTLVIPTIGVNGEIHEGMNADTALEQGIWRVENFGTPEDALPTILAAHRFGYIRWTNEFRTRQSFFNLPKTAEGDTIEVIWNQRKYEYRITFAEDSTVVSDYGADLILYTCRLFNSPVRVFRYAERVN